MIFLITNSLEDIQGSYSEKKFVAANKRALEKKTNYLILYHSKKRLTADEKIKFKTANVIIKTDVNLFSVNMIKKIKDVSSGNIALVENNMCNFDEYLTNAVSQNHMFVVQNGVFI